MKKQKILSLSIQLSDGTIRTWKGELEFKEEKEYSQVIWSKDKATESEADNVGT